MVTTAAGTPVMRIAVDAQPLGVLVEDRNRAADAGGTRRHHVERFDPGLAHRPRDAGQHGVEDAGVRPDTGRLVHVALRRRNDGQRRGLDEHALVALELEQPTGRIGDGRREGDGRGQRVAGRDVDDEGRARELGDRRVGLEAELGHDAGHRDRGADAQRRCRRRRREDENAFRRGRIGVHLGIGGLQIDAVAAPRGDDADRPHGLPDVRRRDAGALDVVDGQLLHRRDRPRRRASRRPTVPDRRRPRAGCSSRRVRRPRRPPGW